MINAVIDRLKTGSVPNVILFGDSAKLPPAPYVCVKPEPGAMNDRLNFRVIVHRKQGEQESLDDYIFSELDKLFNRQVWLEKSGGGKFRLMSSGDWYGPYTEADSKTIVMERVFFVPQRF